MCSADPHQPVLGITIDRQEALAIFKNVSDQSLILALLSWIPPHPTGKDAKFIWPRTTLVMTISSISECGAHTQQRSRNGCSRPSQELRYPSLIRKRIIPAGCPWRGQRETAGVIHRGYHRIKQKNTNAFMCYTFHRTTIDGPHFPLEVSWKIQRHLIILKNFTWTRASLPAPCTPGSMWVNHSTPLIPALSTSPPLSSSRALPRGPNSSPESGQGTSIPGLATPPYDCSKRK